MKTILLDVDGPLCDFLGGLIEAINEDRNLDLRAADCTQWDIGAAFGLPSRYIDALAAEPGFCAGLLPTPLAAKSADRLRQHHDVYAVTSPYAEAPHWMYERAGWLLRMGFDRAHVIHCATKRLIRGDVLIDDKPETICEWAAAWPRSTALLWDAPYNRGVELPANARRVCGWVEALREVGE